jgi:hypothetical protein
MPNKKLTPHERDKERVKNLRGCALRKLSHHEYTHRLMRLLGLVHAMPVCDGFPKEEFVIRSAMISNILIADMHDKLSIEAGTLSFIPQYCPYGKKAEKKWVHKEITDNFGNNCTKLVQEIEELRQTFVDEGDVAGFSQYAKEIYMVHVYLDLVNMFNSYTRVKILDGELIKVRIAKKPVRIDKTITIPEGEEYVVIDGDKMDMPRFYAYMVVVAEWKLEELKHGHTQIKHSLQELCKEIRNTKGVEIYYRDYKD